jgi:GntR family transcriptional regulator/MocR family aminotransferase
VIDTAQTTPLHRQIGEHLRRAILERRLVPGSRLPSSRLIAAELNCARGTVLLAIDQLVAEGYVVTRAGSGMSVAPNLPDDMLIAPKRGPGGDTVADQPVLPDRTLSLLRRPPAPPGPAPIAFALGQPDREAFPFPLWAKLLEKEWRRPAWDVAGAPHPFGHWGLRRAIAAYLSVARGISCEAEAVVITSGVRQSVSLVARIVLAAGDQAWIEDPGYAGIRQALEAAGVRPVAVPIDAAGFSAEAAMAVAPGARLAAVAPSHHFPLGTVLSLQRRLALLGWAERGGHWIIEDDFDGEYRYSGRPLAPLRALDRAGRVAYLGSFSKLLFPALRLSFLVLPATLAAAAEAVMEAVSAPAPLLGQGALARFIDEGHFTAHLRRTRLLYAGRQQALIAAVARHLDGMLTVAADPGGMHLVARPHARIAPQFDDQAVATAAARAGVTATALSACYAGAGKTHGLLLGYAGVPEADIDAAVRRLATYVLF